ncbi:L,D-transpeptidase family protein [Zavarzinia sp. CC-PAN008]|uniref:L,D-transpeptidase family protein n=1 Tax=Zavarzinia sp. CC-PAN008 TaxID=3243332 RepID=UPI003F745ACB
MFPPIRALGRIAALGLLLAAGRPAHAEPVVIGGAAVDLILVEKAQRRLSLIRDGRTVQSFPVALGFAPVGPKQREGDGRTPEGRYRIDARNPRSQYYLSLHVSYPDAYDRLRARQGGYAPGGAIFIHGEPGSAEGRAAARRIGDWTAGCIAVSNAAMDVIWSSVEDGTPIEIRP